MNRGTELAQTLIFEAAPWPRLIGINSPRDWFGGAVRRFARSQTLQRERLRQLASLVECRVAPLTSLSFARLKGWEATKTIHLGIAGVSQVDSIYYTACDTDRSLPGEEDAGS